MDLRQISLGHTPPSDMNAIIEIPRGTSLTKYEIDKESGALFLDRLLTTSMHYPADYGFFPHTLSSDGDPADVLLVSAATTYPGTVVRVRPIGVLDMKDESGHDEKIIAVLHDDLSKESAHIRSISDLSSSLQKSIEHFFEHYKDLEAGKWTQILGWGDQDKAHKVIEEAIIRHDARS